MFRKIGFASTALFALLGFIIYQFQIKLQPADRTQHARLRETPAPLSELEPQKAVQERNGVKKEIWTVKNGQRTLFRLASDHSVLTLTPMRKTFEISEKLQGVTCLVQEEVSAHNNQTIQEIRTLTADSGTYRFPAHQFTADFVDIHFFRLFAEPVPTYPLTATPYLSGQATNVTFSAADKTLHFTASYLKACLDPKQLYTENQ